jgi:mannose-6-phosphate isomerase-like protein (cupin superfamily)
MPRLIAQATRVEAAGNEPKLIDEFVGRVNTGHSEVSIARMRSPAGWIEPGQAPEFDEYTIVLSGSLRVEHRSGVIDVSAGQAIAVQRGEWVRYSTPGSEGAEYIGVCLPAFSLEAARRDPS